MTKRIVAALALLALLAAVPAAALAADEGGGTDSLRIQQLDASGFPEIVMTVSVPGDGSELDAAAFTVTENGIAADLSVEPVSTDDLEVLLVLDASTSMKGDPLAGAKDAAQAFLEVLPPSVQVGVVSFATTPQVLSDFTTDRAESSAAIASINVAGETALYDGVVAAAAQFDPATEGRRTMVVLSDGGDTASEAPIEDAIAALLQPACPSTPSSWRARRTTGSASHGWRPPLKGPWLAPRIRQPSARSSRPSARRSSTSIA